MPVLGNARVVTPSGVLDRGWLRVEGDRIAEVGAGSAPAGATDLAGGWLLPGFVDLHCHGGGGASYTAADTAQARRVAEFHRAHGTTTTLASLVTAPADDLLRCVTALLPLVEDGLVAGIHLEGPYLSARRRGAHDPQHLRSPDPGETDRLLAAGRGAVRMVTIAPELPGAGALISRLVDAGVVVAFGHSDASYAQARAATDAGARVATHLFNGMPPMHHREPGPVGAALVDDRVVCELICDGVHLADPVIRLVFAVAGPGRVAVVTDAMNAAGMSDGTYRLGPVEVEVRGGVARLAGGSSIAGSTLTMDAAVRRAVGAGVPLSDVSAAASGTPAGVLGLTDRGALEPGLRSDLVVLDQNLETAAVMVAGSWVAGRAATAYQEEED